MNKKFKLPKTFALKWVKALKSRKYKQGNSFLINTLTSAKEATIENSTFCCLGVGAVVCGTPIEYLVRMSYIDRRLFKEIPKEIGGSSSILVKVLSRLNDGISRDEFNRLNKKYNFRPNIIEWWKQQPESTLIKTPFSTIANFIEDNCEFIDESK